MKVRFNFRVSRVHAVFSNCSYCSAMNLHSILNHQKGGLNHPRAGLVLGWVTFLALDFLCTLPPMVHPITVGYPGEPGILNQLYVEPRFLSLGEIGAYQLACTHSRCSPSKGGNSLQGPSNSHNARFRMPYRLRPTQK